MKQVFLVMVILWAGACATETSVRRDEPIPAEPITEAPAQTLNMPVLPSGEPVTPLYGELLDEVKVSRSSFNPNLGEEVAVYFLLSRPSKVNAKVYDPDHGLTQVLAVAQSMNAGQNTIVWDGRDLDANLVPDEAYYFTITAENDSGTKEIYDPTTFSGGVEHDITTADIDPQSHTINYRMPQMGRVTLRMGIHGGPLMNTLVDWKPRVKGAITEYWNGKDKDNLVDLYRHPKFKMIITYFTLPENSVIAFGNNELTFREYKKSIGTNRPVKQDQPRSVAGKLSPHYALPRTKDYVPDVKVTFSKSEGTEPDGTIILKEKTLVKVELAEEDKRIFQDQQFEICFFLDYDFYAEDEAGYTPFNWVWDLSNVEEGDHLLTVNISSFKDQIGLLSRKVRVVKE